MGNNSSEGPFVSVKLNGSLAGNLMVLSAINKKTPELMVAEAVAAYLAANGLDPRRKPKLEFP